VILSDETINSSEEANGGTGKTLIAQAIGKMRTMVIKDGKHLKGSDRFIYQDVDDSTDILLVDDVQPDFRFDSMFPALTTGIQRERKYEQKTFIPYERSPKIIIATNYALGGPIGSSTERRKFEIEISNFYGLDFTPYDHYGHQFFRDWTSDEWNRFYSFMFECVRLHLERGLVKYSRLNTVRKRLIQSTSESFVEFVENNIEVSGRYEKRAVRDMYVEEYNIRDLSQHMFTKWLSRYCAITGLVLNAQRSNGLDYFTFEVH